MPFHHHRETPDDLDDPVNPDEWHRWYDHLDWWERRRRRREYRWRRNQPRFAPRRPLDRHELPGGGFPGPSDRGLRGGPLATAREVRAVLREMLKRAPRQREVDYVLAGRTHQARRRRIDEVVSRGVPARRPEDFPGRGPRRRSPSRRPRPRRDAGQRSRRRRPRASTGRATSRPLPRIPRERTGPARPIPPVVWLPPPEGASDWPVEEDRPHTRRRPPRPVPVEPYPGHRRTWEPPPAPPLEPEWERPVPVVTGDPEGDLPPVHTGGPGSVRWPRIDAYPDGWPITWDELRNYFLWLLSQVDYYPASRYRRGSREMDEEQQAEEIRCAETLRRASRRPRAPWPYSYQTLLACAETVSRITSPDV